jgi:hypothetical protein
MMEFIILMLSLPVNTHNNRGESIFANLGHTGK